jgi:hypothetical protein
MKIASRGIKESEDWVEPMASKQPLHLPLYRTFREEDRGHTDKGG